MDDNCPAPGRIRVIDRRSYGVEIPQDLSPSQFCDGWQKRLEMGQHVLKRHSEHRHSSGRFAALGAREPFSWSLRVSNLRGLLQNELHGDQRFHVDGFARIARTTVLSDNAFGVLVPVLEQIVGRRPPEIRDFFESYRLSLHDWEKARTDRVTIRGSSHFATVDIDAPLPGTIQT